MIRRIRVIGLVVVALLMMGAEWSCHDTQAKPGQTAPKPAPADPAPDITEPDKPKYIVLFRVISDVPDNSGHRKTITWTVGSLGDVVGTSIPIWEHIERGYTGARLTLLVEQHADVKFVQCSLYVNGNLKDYQHTGRGSAADCQLEYTIQAGD